MNMKKMKYIVPLCIALFTAGFARAQEFKVAVENSKEGKLVLDGFRGDLRVEGYSGTEIVVSAESGRFETPEQARGLKPVYSAGVDNTGVGVAMEKNGNRVTLHCLLPINRGADYTVRVPDNMSLDITRDCAGGGDTHIESIKNEIEFQGCHDISLKNVTGPLVISTISGSVNVTFTELSKDKPISITSVSGSVDVTVPAKTGFSLEMGTVSGNMYSDFDFPASANNDMRRVGGGSLRVQINGGGPDLKLQSVSGNVYLRKG
jgi:lia operon protein LiaG